MLDRLYTAAQVARALSVNPRSVRRWIAAGQVPGARQVDSAAGSTWYVPASSLDQLRSRVAHAAQVVAPVLPVAAPPVDVPDGSQLAQVPASADSSGGDVVRALLAHHGAALDALRDQLAHQRDDALWWRCEALDAQQQLAQVRQQLDAAQLDLAQLRAVVAHHQRETVPVGQLRQQLRAIDGGA